MALSTSAILDVLAAYGIRPLEDAPDEINLPGIGEIVEGETVYATSISEVFSPSDGLDGGDVAPDADEPRLREWQRELDRVIEGQQGRALIPERRGRPREEPPEPHCAWYCPTHFFGHGWGIYIREGCILSHALDIATSVHWPSVRAPRGQIARHLLRSAFYVFFLHEQFHHKIESLGFLLLISTGADRYRPYKYIVYRRMLLTAGCLEESLANAESYRRLGEERYAKRIDPAIRQGMRNYLQASFRMQPPGYAEGVRYLPDKDYRTGLFSQQSQVLDGAIPPTTPVGVAPRSVQEQRWILLA